jgi:hypothetical protein
MRHQQLMSACLSVAGLALMGCAHTRAPHESSHVDESRRLDTVCREAVALYSAPREIGAAFQFVAVLKDAEEARRVNEPLTMNAVRRHAAKTRATGVILPSYTVGEKAERVFAPMIVRSRRGVIQGAARPARCRAGTRRAEIS